MKTQELGSRATEPQPCLSPHLKYTINMLKTRPELSEIATFPLPCCADKERVARPVFHSLVTRLVKASRLDPLLLSLELSPHLESLPRNYRGAAEHHRGNLLKISSKFFEIGEKVSYISSFFIETRETGLNIGDKIDFPPRPIASTIIERN